MADNIIRFDTKIKKEDREKLLSQKGCVIWFTGLSGSGKSTIANAVESRLNDEGLLTYMLDGDNIRKGINSDLGFSNEDRDENIRRISHIASLFADCGVITLVSFISPFRKMREMARTLVPEGSFIEVYVKADYETCAKRDPKGLYQKDIKSFTGRDSSYEAPECCELVLDTESLDVDSCALKVIELIKRFEQ